MNLLAVPLKSIATLIVKFQEFLERLRPASRWLVIGALLVVFVGSLVPLLTTRNQILSRFYDSVSAKLAPTTQSYKGIEAQVLGGLDLDGIHPGDNKLDDLDPRTRKLFQNIVEQIKPIPNKTGTPQTQADLGTQSLIQFLRRGGDRRSPKSEEFLTLKAGSLPWERNSPGEQDSTEQMFLYVPPIALGGVTAKEFLKNPLRRNVNVITNLLLLSKIGRDVSAFTDLPLYTNVPSSLIVQSYFLFQNGILLIHQGRIPEKDQQAHYEAQFTGHMFLPERHYFWNAIQSRNSKTNVKDIQTRNMSDMDYVSAPYIDLGTNGPIRTYCWGFLGSDVESNNEAVLCLDVQLSHNVARSIQSNLTKLTKVTPVYCDLVSGECFYENNNRHNPYLSDYARVVKESNRSVVFGGILVFQGDRQERGFFDSIMASFSFISQQPLKFTVPLGTYVANGSRRISLIECVLDLELMRGRDALLFLLTVGSGTLLITALVNLVAIDFRQREQQQRSVKSLNAVMNNASDPFVMVDCDDNIIGCNKAFEELIEEEEANGKPIKKYLSIAGQQAYDSQMPMRRKFEYSSYPVSIKTQHHGEKPMTVFGAPVPAAAAAPESHPYSFAIMKKVVGGAHDGSVTPNGDPKETRVNAAKL